MSKKRKTLPTTVKFLGYVVEGFSYNIIYFLFSEIFVKNEYFFKTHATCPIIYDCRANIGVAVLYFKLLYPEAIIYAFEADPSSVDVLRRNIKNNNLQNIFVHQVALSADDGTVDFFIDSNCSGSLKMATIKRGEKNSVVQVPAKTLSSYMLNTECVDFLKMDIEGSEIDVVREMSQISKSLKKVVAATFEYHHHIGSKKADLSNFLGDLERSNFDYILSVRQVCGYKPKLFQDIMVFCTRIDGE